MDKGNAPEGAIVETNKDNDLSSENQKKAMENILCLVNKPDTPIDTGKFSIKPANQWMVEAASRPNPLPLWNPFWNEGELCCLFSDSNLGKSIYAVQIAIEIAKIKKVLYFDFELSDKQFQLRYTDKDGNMYVFPDNFLRAEINPDLINIAEFEDEIINGVEQIVVGSSINIIIIDNLTYLCSNSEKGDAAGRLMIRLMQLKKKYNLSLLILAHTPKRTLCAPITQNDLAGSKKLFNFFDSCFSIGKSAKDENLRYIKQLKVRAGAYECDSNNVIVCEIIKDVNWLHFNEIGYSTEKEHLREPTEKDLNQESENVRELRESGKSMREIANVLGISKSKVFRICQKI